MRKTLLARCSIFQRPPENVRLHAIRGLLERHPVQPVNENTKTIENNKPGKISTASYDWCTFSYRANSISTNVFKFLTSVLLTMAATKMSRFTSTMLRRSLMRFCSAGNSNARNICNYTQNATDKFYELWLQLIMTSLKIIKKRQQKITEMHFSLFIWIRRWSTMKKMNGTEKTEQQGEWRRNKVYICNSFAYEWVSN